MNNKQIFPFERNRYYVGKLLTSVDFQAEQTYMGNKRRFLNEMLFGSGIVCGLGVYALDDVSLMVESGVAIDSWGRELVLDSSIVRKLDMIDGFDSLTSDRAVLCLSYDEKPEQPVYTVNRQNQEEYEMNRLREGAKLILVDVQDDTEDQVPENEFFSRTPLYTDSDYEVELSIPAHIPCGSRVNMTVRVTKLSDSVRSFFMNCVLQSPALINDNGTHESTVTVDDISLSQGETIERTVWLTAQERPAKDSVIIAEPGQLDVRLDGQRTQLGEKLTARAAIEDASLEDILDRELGRVSLENRMMTLKASYIRLAEISLQRTRNHCIMESVKEEGIKQYIRTNSEEIERRKLRNYYDEVNNSKVIIQNKNSDDLVFDNKPLQNTPQFATGVCEIPLNKHSSLEHVLYSDEIMHGLGKGDVFVDVGIEYLSEDPKTNHISRSVIYGNSELFENDRTNIPRIDLAIKVMSDRGSFMAAVKLLEPTDNVMLVLRWMAYKIPSTTDKLERYEKGKRISAVPPTIVMGTKESRYFQVQFHNMEPCTLTYTLSEKGSGEITTDGVYTAPSREGVYEIQISCSDDPMISTYAYAVVKKVDELEEQNNK